MAPSTKTWVSAVPAQAPLPGAAEQLRGDYEESVDFWVVQQERGSEGGMCSVWASDEHVPRMHGNESQERMQRLKLNESMQSSKSIIRTSSMPCAQQAMMNEHGVTREDIPLGLHPHTGQPVRTAMLLSNVLSPEECDQIIAVAESMGFKGDATVVLNRKVRQNLMLPWVMPDSLVNDTIFKRIESLVPQSVLLGYSRGRQQVVVGPPVGVNRRVHFYKYVDSGDHFKPHHDGSRHESPGLSQGPGKRDLVEDVADGSRHTFMTLLLYLDDGFAGGETEFFTMDADVKVVPKKGSILAFFHGDHPESQLHAGCAITSGKKTVAWMGLEYDVSEPRLV